MATTVTLKPNAIDLSGSTSGTTTLQATAVAGTTTITLPAATDTLVGRATTDTLTNKTLTTPVISSLSSASATALTLQSAGTTAITVDTSQNVGIGTSSPAAKLDLNKGSAGLLANFTDGVNTNFQISTSGFIATAGPTAGSTSLALQTGGTERMRIDSSGRVLIGTTNTDPTFNRVNGLNLNPSGSILSRSTAGWDCGINSTSGLNIGFYTDNGSSRVSGGNISTNGSVTAYNVASDYRLKQNIAPLQNSLSKVLQLKPCSYNYIEGNQYSEGFIAHELAEVCPDAVTGKKDAVNEDDSIKAQGVDTSFLVATLTAALQETKALLDTQAETINALTARIVALEAK